MTEARTPKQILQSRWSSMEQERSSWIPHYRELNDFILPRSGQFFVNDANNGAKKYNNIYDSTGTRALRVLGAGLMGGATSPARPWFRLATPNRDLMKSQNVKLWLSQATQQMLSVIALSNIYRVLHSQYEDLGVFATAPAFVMDDFEKVVHATPVPVGSYCLAQNEKYEIDTIARKIPMTVRNMVTRFGKANCSVAVQNLYDNSEYDKVFSVIHVVEPRLDYDRTKKDNMNMPFKSCYYEEGGEDTKFLSESGMKRFRCLAPRWSVTTGDIYGSNCPGMEALGDIKQLQHEQIRKAEGIDHMTKPALQVPSSLKNREVDRLPGGSTYYDGTSPTGGVKRLFDVNLDLNHLLMDIKDVRERIRDAFYYELFLMLSNIQDHRMTATEVAERHEEKLLMLGPVLERLHNELLEPLVGMVFERMLETGMLPPPPPEMDGQDLTVEFVSMLAQAQRAVSTNSVDRYVARLGEIAVHKPGVLDKFNEDHWADSYADMLGVDPELVVSDKNVALIRNAKARAAQQQQQVAQMEQMSKAAANLGGAPTDSKNALTDVIQMFSGYGTPQAM